MSIHKSFFNHIFSNRKKIGVVLASLLLMVLFQNCGNAGSTAANTNPTVLASEVPPTGTPPPAGTPASCSATVPCNVGVACSTTTGVPTLVNQGWVNGAANCGFNCIGGFTGATCATPPVVGTVLPLAEQRAACNTALTTPTLNSIFTQGTTTAATSAVIRSGLGATNSGDSGSVNLDFAVDRGISNAAVFNLAANNCNSHVSSRLRCTVVATNPANPGDAPLSVTNAFDSAGNNLLAATPAITQTALATSSYDNGDCEAQLGLGATNGTFQISPDTQTRRCVQGNFWLRIIAQTAVAGVNGSNRDSAPVYFKVTVNNGCWVESRLKDSAGDLGRVINFGTAVAIDGNWAAVVAPTDDASTAVLDVGAVYMYMFDGSNWVQKERLVIAGASAMDTIASVAIRGDSMVIGSPYNSGSGAVYFFRRSGETWIRVDSEAAPNAAASQAFGQTVAINDRYVFVGSPNYSGALVKNGGVAIYSHSAAGMTYIRTLFGASANMAFGSSIAVDNTVLAVGAPQALGREGSAPGSVFVFDEASGAFNLVATKTGSINAEKFGASVAVFGSRLAVGSPNYIVGGVAGFGRVTYYDAYSAAATRTIQGGVSTENLGQGVALSSTGLYVGVPFANNRAGRVDHYLYTNINTLYFRNLAYNEANNSGYGFAVAASGNNVIIGARIKSDPNDNSGAAYIYRFK